MKAIAFLLAIAVLEFTTAQHQPLLLKYHDDNGNVRMSIVKDSKWRRYQSGDSESDSETVGSDETSDDRHTANLYEYARRDGPHEDSEDVNERYNISEEEELRGYENAEAYNESDNDDESSMYQQIRFPHAEDYQESESVSEDKPIERQQRRKSKSKKTVYVYKQPPIIVKPKPTNVYIKSKPIVVQPPPLVVHHPEPKPCNPIINYRPPNIRLKPVIVKISKPKTTTTTTTTTTCRPTTKKPCRRCRTKPTKKCGRCSRRKQTKNSKPRIIDDFTIYLDKNRFRQEETQFIRDGVMT